MKNYYFDKYFNLLEENMINSCGEIDYIVVNDVVDFKAFCDEIDMIDDGVTSTGIYYYDTDFGNWEKLNPDANDVLKKYLNKIEDNTMENKEKTFNFSIEFKNGGFISEENCDKSFDEIINSVKDLYNSAVFGGNVKKITIEMN